MSHTPEPWAAYQDGKLEMKNINHFIKSLSGDLVSYGHLSKADARRIVACVNALAGVSTEGLENNPSGGLKNMAVVHQSFVDRYEDTVLQRDKLEKRVESLINQLSDHKRQAAIGKAIERACKELPEGFEVHVECEKDAANIRLYQPDGEECSEDLYCDSGLGGEIDNAINFACAKGGAA